ncbi:hypothetical protein ACRRTK_006328 [Alexandromys fortis]
MCVPQGSHASLLLSPDVCPVLYSLLVTSDSWGSWGRPQWSECVNKTAIAVVGTQDPLQAPLHSLPQSLQDEDVHTCRAALPTTCQERA